MKALLSTNKEFQENINYWCSNKRFVTFQSPIDAYRYALICRMSLEAK